MPKRLYIIGYKERLVANERWNIMLKNPEETEPLLPENPEDAGSSEDTKRTAQEKHEMFKKEIEGAQVSISCGFFNIFW